MLTRYDEQMRALPTPLFIADTNRVFFTFFAQQDEWFQVMVCDESYAPYVNHMLYGSLQQNRSRFDTIASRSAAERSLIDHFTVDASLSLYRYWRQSGTSLTIDEVIDLTGRLLEGGLSAVRE